MLLFLLLFLGETVGFVNELDISYELLSFFVDSFNSVCTILIWEIFFGEYDFISYYLLCTQTSPHSSTNCGFFSLRNAFDMLQHIKANKIFAVPDSQREAERVRTT